MGLRAWQRFVSDSWRSPYHPSHVASHLCRSYSFEKHDKNFYDRKTQRIQGGKREPKCGKKSHWVVWFRTFVLHSKLLLTPTLISLMINPEIKFQKKGLMRGDAVSLGGNPCRISGAGYSDEEARARRADKDISYECSLGGYS